MIWVHNVQMMTTGSIAFSGFDLVQCACVMLDLGCLILLQRETNELKSSVDLSEFERVCI